MFQEKEDEDKNEAKSENSEQTVDIEMIPQEKGAEAKPENNENVEPNDIMNGAKSDKGCTEQQLNDITSDIMKPESNDVMVHKADNGISDGGSTEGCVLQDAGDLLEGMMKAIKSEASVEFKAVDEKSSKGMPDVLADSSSEDSDLDDNKKLWSHHKDKFEKCLTKLTKHIVKKDDITEKSYDELCKLLVLPKALYRERKRFYSAQRAPTESKADYIKRLTDLSNTCQFGESQDFMISDKFIVGDDVHSIYRGNKSLWKDLQKEIDSKKALEMAQSKEDVDPMDAYIDKLMGRGRGNTKNVPPHLAEMIRNEIMEKDLSVEWDDIAGLDYPKSIIIESIVWPLLRPDIFTGLRKSPKAMLLFGPPGTGKTMMVKCIAAQSKSTFFYVSASTMASKWHGESEQLVRALFTTAAEHQPAVIFFDEVDSLLTQRSSGDHAISRRVKTEFMIHLDGAATKDDTRVLFIGATNRPQDLDEAARRRFVKRLYVPLPDLPARRQLLNILLKSHRSNMTDNDVNEIATMTNEFSGADIKWLCQDAAMEPLRSIPGDGIKDVDVKDIRPLEVKDFVRSLKRIRPSVASADLTAMVEWNRLYGSNSERPSFKDNHFMYS